MAQLKSNLTKTEYQSTFLPLIEKTSTEIKKLILTSALLFLSLTYLKSKINKLIKDLEEQLPKELHDKDTYILGLRQSADKMIATTYKPIVLTFLGASAILIKRGLTSKKEVSTPIELSDFIVKLEEKPHRLPQKTRAILHERIDVASQIKPNMPDENVDLWSMAKASPRVKDYDKKIKSYINDLTEQEILTGETDRKISIWQKAELDIRHANQMEMLSNLKKQGVKLAWLSSHPDCSKRCQPWQGKLVDLVNHASGPNFSMDYKVENNHVYSLTDIMNQVDKYGYKNNIINGFNCRHHIIPWTPNSLPPREYTARDIKKERRINANLREMERKIRNLKQKAILYGRINKEEGLWYKRKAQLLTEKYKEYANKNGFAWYEYRIKV